MWSSILKLLINIDRHDFQRIVVARRTNASEHKEFAKTSENKLLLTCRPQKPRLKDEQVLPTTLSGLLN